MNLTNIILMKVGFHGQEDLKTIISRKKKEERDFDFAYWGYGGVLLHPHKTIQPFIKNTKKEVTVCFVQTPSPFHSTKAHAKELSIDGKVWHPLGRHKITASKYALAIRDIKPVNFNINLGEYSVAAGPSAGKQLDNYFRFRVDKALAIKTRKNTEDKSVSVSFTARLVSPYAVSVRS